MSNRAAISNGNTKVPFYDIKTTSIPSVTKDGILVKAVAYAANPTDWKHLVYKLGEEGSIVGTDFSGIVQEVGSDVKGFAKGDYVSSWLHGNFEKNVGAFQDYVLTDPVMTIKYDKSTFKTEPLPIGVSPSGPIDTFEGAASVTGGFSTVAYSLAHVLKLKPTDVSNKEKYLLIWGAATATGTLLIQAAKIIYGLKVIAVASSSHTDFLKKAGADAVIDYKSDDVVTKIKEVGGSKIHYAVDTISTSETWQAVYDATSETTEGTVRLDNLGVLGPDKLKIDKSRNNVEFGTTLSYIVNGKPVNLGGGDIVPTKELIKDYNNFWQNILPPVLPKFKHTNLKVLKAGLESADEAFTLLIENKVRAEKVVFRASS